MAKPIIQKVGGNKAVVVYQQVEDGVGEPALLVEYYSDSIAISQDDNCILVNRETIEELCKVLKKPLV